MKENNQPPTRQQQAPPPPHDDVESINHLSSLMAQRPHVPQFGKWDNAQNAAYTVYFEEARKGRTSGGKMTNPNDPEDNPDILPRTMAPTAPRRQSPNDVGGTIRSNEQRGKKQLPARGRGGSLGSEHSIERSPMHPRGRGEAKNQGTAVPIFGEWDVKNPASAEGYTDIFNQVRVERERGPSNTPGRDNFNNNYNNHHPRNPASDSSSSHKICCFPWCR